MNPEQDAHHEIEGYRARYRAEHISKRYRGAAHFAFTSVFSLVLIAYSLTQLHAVLAWEWLTIPLTVVYANLAEYWGHRLVMHRPVPGLRLIYRRHAGQHHRFFTHEHMGYDSTRDFKAVLFPPVLASFFLLAFAAPAGWLVSWLTTANCAWLFVASGVGYFYHYEILHLAYHLPADHALTRLPGLAALRRLHTAHHDPRWMSTRNFNITYPIGDWIFRTLAR
jgi:hypothetical protein